MKSKFKGLEDSLFLPEVVDAACINFAKCVPFPRNLANEDLIMYRSPSLGIVGWSHQDLVVLDYGEID